MNELKIFENPKFGQIRTITENRKDAVLRQGCSDGAGVQAPERRHFRTLSWYGKTPYHRFYG